ncbi:MAG: aldose epimerase family protein [Pseudomonadota bacterium]
MSDFFGVTGSGEDVHAIDIGSEALRVRVLTFGAVLNDVRLEGVAHPLTLGAPDIAAYEGPLASFGALMGPVVNRIHGAAARIAGQEHRFEANFEGKHTLHSGGGGTHEQVWRLTEQSPRSATLELTLPDGLGGFPGNRWFRAIYTVKANALTLEVTASSDAPTLLSLANHSYWALDSTPGFAGHGITIPAGRYVEAGDDLMPTGTILDVAGTPFDARAGRMLSGGESEFFDLNYCFCEGDRALHEVARLRGREGIEMSMESTAPGLQVYDCGTIDGGPHRTHHGAPYRRYAGVALEAQRWPGAARHSAFPSIEYSAGARFHQITRWRFSR